MIAKDISSFFSPPLYSKSLRKHRKILLFALLSEEEHGRIGNARGSSRTSLTTNETHADRSMMLAFIPLPSLQRKRILCSLKSAGRLSDLAGCCCGRSADLESAGVYPPIVIQLAGAAFAERDRLRSYCTMAIGLGTSANEFTMTQAVNEVNSVSCRARSITYQAHRAEPGCSPGAATRSRGCSVEIIISLAFVPVANTR